jgi:hypothetical protein
MKLNLKKRKEKNHKKVIKAKILARNKTKEFLMLQEKIHQTNKKV